MACRLMNSSKVIFYFVARYPYLMLLLNMIHVVKFLGLTRHATGSGFSNFISGAYNTALLKNEQRTNMEQK